MAREPSQSTRCGKPWSATALSDALVRVHGEFIRGAHVAPFHSAHEGVAKIREEYLELERECFEQKRERTDWDARLEEALHVATVALKFIIEFREEE